MIKTGSFRRKSITHKGMIIHPIKIYGNWDSGYALDKHSLHSEFLGIDEFGHNIYETTRSEIGEAVYQLKYQNNLSFIDLLADVSANAINELILVEKNTLDCIVPVPPSDPNRKEQPVFQIAKRISEILKIQYDDNLIEKTVHTEQMKNLPIAERASELKNAYSVSEKDLSYNNILLFDDLYQSGATAKACVEALKSRKANIKVFLITITKTRR
jgi:predicted amidophosphoribosyltransferase